MVAVESPAISYYIAFTAHHSTTYSDLNASHNEFAFQVKTMIAPPFFPLTSFFLSCNCCMMENKPPPMDESKPQEAPLTDPYIM